MSVFRLVDALVLGTTTINHWPPIKSAGRHIACKILQNWKLLQFIMLPTKQLPYKLLSVNCDYYDMTVIAAVSFGLNNNFDHHRKANKKSRTYSSVYSLTWHYWLWFSGSAGSAGGHCNVWPGCWPGCQDSVTGWHTNEQVESTPVTPGLQNMVRAG